MTKIKNTVVPTTDAEKQLAALNEQAAALAAKIEVQREANAKLLADKVTGLPAYLGVTDLAAVLKLVRKAGKPAGKRTPITDAQKAKVVELAKSGKTGAEIESATGLSSSSVQNIKKAAGLVTTRKKK
jgi:uncharacterized protein YerC